MKHKKTLLVLTLVDSCIVGTNAQASLFDRGGGLLYDDVLNVTWLQDANYAKSSGFSTTGKMDWYTATSWAASLIFHDNVRNVDYSDWLLASNSPINGISYNTTYSYTGNTDSGYNVISQYAELAYMYNVNLGLKGFIAPTGVLQADFGIFGNGTFNGVDQNSFGQNNFDFVKNLQSFVYWSGSDKLIFYGFADVKIDVAFSFDTDDGNQTISRKEIPNYAWAVRDGDVAPVPIPATIYLFATGLLGLLRFKRHKSA